jgi:uncharacterized protein YjiS (DUF1127 family)
VAIVDDFTPAVPARASARPGLQLLRSGLAAFARGMAAGWRAAADYRQLSEMSDRQLRLRGLSRNDIPQDLHKRHFASLRGGLDAID